MGIASIARYSLAMIQHSSDSAFAGGCDSAFAIAAFTRGSVIGAAFASGSFCGWQHLHAAFFCGWLRYLLQWNVRLV